MDAANSSSPASPIPAPPPAPVAPVRAWSHAVQSSLVVLVGSVVVGLVAHSVLQGNVQRPAPWSGEPPLTRIDLNRAGRAELRLLPGVGEKLAERIEAYRILNGPYQSIDELRKVPGIGPLTIERLRPWLIVSASTAMARRETPEAAPIKLEMPRSSQKEASL